LTIEADLTNNIDFECVVSEFAKLTSMKKGNYLVSRYIPGYAVIAVAVT